MAFNEKHGTRDESPEASVAETRAANRCPASSDHQRDGEHGIEKVSRESINKPTSAGRVSLQDTDVTVADKRNSEVVQGDQDVMTSNIERSEDSQQEEPLQDKRDSPEKEPLQQSDDAVASDVTANPPRKPGDLQRHRAQQDAAHSTSAATTERGSVVPVPQRSGQSSPPSAPRTPPAVVESRSSGVRERDDRKAPASHTAGRHEPYRRESYRAPQAVRKTQLSKTSGLLEPRESLQSRPATTWQRQMSKTSIKSTSSTASRERIRVAARGTRTASLSGQLKQQPHQRNFKTHAAPSVEANDEIDVDASRRGRSSTTPPLSSRDERSPDEDQSTPAQSPVEEDSVCGRKTSSTGFPTPGNRSPSGSDKGVLVPEVADEGSRRASVAQTASSKLRSPPVPPRRYLPAERSSVSENGSEGSRTSTAGSVSPNDSLTPQLKQQHTFDPPWMKKRQLKDSELLPFAFGSSRDQTSPLLTTSTGWRQSLFHAGKLRKGTAQRGDSFGSLRSPSNIMSSTTEGFFTEKEVGVKAFFRNQPIAVMLCALLLLVVVGVLLLLLGAFGGRLDRRRGPAAVCRTEPCREYARRLVASMNSSVNPCEGFTHFVCDGWRRHNRLSVRESAFLSELRRMSYLLRSVPVPRKAQKPIQRAAAFYRSCEAVRRGDIDELPKVKSALLQAGIVWPRLPKDRDSINLLRTLLHASLKLRWSVVLHASVEHGPNSTIVTLDPLREFQRIVEKHLRMAKSVQAAELYFETLRRDFGGASVKPMEGTVTFADQAKLESVYMVQLSGAFYLPTRSGAQESVDVFGLVPELSEERWVAELGYYGDVSKPLVFRTQEPGYVKAFLELWRERGERDMHLFYSWCVVQIAARYASRRLLFNFYGCEDCADLYHGAFCLSKAYLLAGNHIFLEYFEGIFSEQAEKSARGVVSDTLEAFALQIDAGPYGDANHTALHGSSYNATNAILRYFDPHFGSGKHKHAEAAVFNPGDMDNSLVENWQSIVPHLGDVRDRWAASEAIEFVEWTALVPDHVLAVLPHALSVPSFDESATRFMNQAGLGNHVASALSAHFLQRYANSSGTAASLLHSSNYPTNASRFGDPSSATRLLGVLTRVLALEVSLNAYQAGGAVKSDENLDGFDGYSTTAMFFVASCYALCGGQDGVHHFTGEECDEPFRNASGFAGAFACEPGSLMNPLNECAR